MCRSVIMFNKKKKKCILHLLEQKLKEYKNSMWYGIKPFCLRQNLCCWSSNRNFVLHTLKTCDVWKKGIELNVHKYNKIPSRFTLFKVFPI